MKHRRIVPALFLLGAGCVAGCVSVSAADQQQVTTNRITAEAALARYRADPASLDVDFFLDQNVRMWRATERIVRPAAKPAGVEVSQ